MRTAFSDSTVQYVLFSPSECERTTAGVPLRTKPRQDYIADGAVLVIPSFSLKSQRDDWQWGRGRERGLGEGGRGNLDDRVWKLHALQHDRILLITQSLSSDDILQPSQSHNVSCPCNLHTQTQALIVDAFNHFDAARCVLHSQTWGLHQRLQHHQITQQLLQ